MGVIAPCLTTVLGFRAVLCDFSLLLWEFCQAVFVEEVFRAAMSTAGTYDASCNLFWLNLKWSAAPKVPVNRSSVDRLKERLFSNGPQRFDKVTVVAVGEDLVVNRGNLRRVSPEEPEHAFIFALSDAISRGESHEVLLLLDSTTTVDML